MYGPAGYAYAYFTYGKHWLLNVVTESPGFPAAVLIRGIKPVEGLPEIAARRAGRPSAEWTNGPGKLCQALDITGAQNGLDLLAPAADLFIESGDPIPDQHIIAGPRVGIDRVPEPWRSIPWRFRVTRDR
jgi:DNA-3-methyladenine glycosylase